MGQTTKWQLPYPEATDPADVPTDIRELAQALDPLLASGPALVTSLPAGPTDGQEIYLLVDAANSVIWQLRYRTAASRWEFLGGPSIVANSAASETTTSSTFVNAVQGPSITVAFAGDYDLQLITQGTNSNAGAGFIFNAAVGGVDFATLPDQAVATCPVANGYMPASNVPKRITVAAGTAITSRIRITSAGTATFGAKQFRLTPLRIG